MRRNTALLCVGLFLSCAEHEPSVTLDDAVAFGYEEIDCPEAASVPIYAGGQPAASIDTYCARVFDAMEAAETSALLEPGLVPDSLRVIVVRSVQFASVPALPDYPSSGFIVYFDFVGRPQNLHVEMPGPEGRVDVNWAQEGLRF